ncbi:hypothetical protein TRFO_23344 [Tritrichomonas foetus]|uniref:Uncharacterized protein n=1 Tax=Tritrichomonas foetus TaxID=1144522 RepID=A0A1J4K9U2_9EUKA|nr:hypothetical protein TRFO_23344 [Tritrichomonas foetus]|eukprot:OHT08199.1 hypothetical protein TRFO_23344 [Tritrichomonas foetus]
MHMFFLVWLYKHTHEYNYCLSDNMMNCTSYDITTFDIYHNSDELISQISKYHDLIPIIYIDIDMEFQFSPSLINFSFLVLIGNNNNNKVTIKQTNYRDNINGITITNCTIKIMSMHASYMLEVRIFIVSNSYLSNNSSLLFSIASANIRIDDNILYSISEMHFLNIYINHLRYQDLGNIVHHVLFKSLNSSFSSITINQENSINDNSINAFLTNNTLNMQYDSINMTYQITEVTQINITLSNNTEMRLVGATNKKLDFFFKMVSNVVLYLVGYFLPNSFEFHIINLDITNSMVICHSYITIENITINGQGILITDVNINVGQYVIINGVFDLQVEKKNFISNIENVMMIRGDFYISTDYSYKIYISHVLSGNESTDSSINFPFFLVHALIPGKSKVLFSEKITVISKEVGIEIVLQPLPHYTLDIVPFYIKELEADNIEIPIILRYQYYDKFNQKYRRMFMAENYLVPINVVILEFLKSDIVFQMTDAFLVHDTVDSLIEDPKYFDVNQNIIKDNITVISTTIARIFEIEEIIYCFGNEAEISLLCPDNSFYVQSSNISAGWTWDGWGTEMSKATKIIEFHFIFKSESYLFLNLSLINNSDTIRFVSSQQNKVVMVEINNYLADNTKIMQVENVNIIVNNNNESIENVTCAIESLELIKGTLHHVNFPLINNFSIHYDQFYDHMDIINDASMVYLNSIEDFDTIIYNDNGISLVNSMTDESFYLFLSDLNCTKELNSILVQNNNFTWRIIKNNSMMNYHLNLKTNITDPIFIIGDFERNILFMDVDYSQLSIDLSYTNRIPISIDFNGYVVASLTLEAEMMAHQKTYIIDSDINLYNSSNFTIYINDIIYVVIDSILHISGGSFNSNNADLIQINNINVTDGGFDITEINHVTIGSKITMNHVSSMIITNSIFNNTEIDYFLPYASNPPQVISRGNSLPKLLRIYHQSNFKLDENKKWWFLEKKPIYCVDCNCPSSQKLDEISIEIIDKIIISGNDKYRLYTSIDSYIDNKMCIFIEKATVRELSTGIIVAITVVCFVLASFFIIIGVCCFTRKKLKYLN